MVYVQPAVSLNDRANAAAEAARAQKQAREAAKKAAREQAHQGAMSAWRVLADRPGRYRQFNSESRAYPVSNTTKPSNDSPYKAPKMPKPQRSNEPDVQAAASPSTNTWSSPGERAAAYAEYADTLTKYGFKRGEVMQFLKGLTYTQLQNPALVTQAFRETGAWRERFGGVTKSREKNGMSYLNEGEIIQLEDTYRQIFTAAGIPKKFWQREDLHDLIAKDVSPQEVADRVKLAEQAVNNTDPDYVRAFREFYGIGKKGLVGYMLNRKRGVQVLQEQVAAAEIGAEARQIGMDSVGRKYAEELVDKDISRQEARQAFANVADTDQDWQKLAKMGGESLSERGLINDELGLDKEGKVGQKKRRLASQERARFGGSNAGTAGLGASTSGAY